MTSIIQIDDILVSSEILTEYFCCDYEVCKGACCIIGDSGAPLEEVECEALESEYPKFSPLMSPEGRLVVSQKGFFEVDVDGDMVTPLVGCGGKCAYTIVDEQEHCYCSIERSFIAGDSNFKKPISCWLYPIRVTKLRSGMPQPLHRNMTFYKFCRVRSLRQKQNNYRLQLFYQIRGHRLYRRQIRQS